jgi:hypothetical protein
LFWAGWVLVFTTVAPSLLGAETISALSRVRGQIELAIKRWKSVLDVGKLRAKEGRPLTEVWLLGTLLYALVVERRAPPGRGRVEEPAPAMRRNRVYV